MAETNPAIDVWAIGVMFYTLLFGMLPFHSSVEKDLVKMIKNDNVKFPRDTPITNECKEVIKQMLEKDPEKRLQLIDFVQSEYALMDEEEFEKVFEDTISKFEE